MLLGSYFEDREVVISRHKDRRVGASDRKACIVSQTMHQQQAWAAYPAFEHGPLTPSAVCFTSANTADVLYIPLVLHIANTAELLHNPVGPSSKGSSQEVCNLT